MQEEARKILAWLTFASLSPSSILIFPSTVKSREESDNG